MSWLDSQSGFNFKDRVTFNTAVFNDKVGMRWAKATGAEGELGSLDNVQLPEGVVPPNYSPPNEVYDQHMPMLRQGQNPFNESQYNNTNLPDNPINTPPTVISQLLNDDSTPIEIREKYWFIFNKDNILTFVDEERKKQKLLNFDIIKIDLLNSMPYYDYNFEKELEFGIIRNIFETKLDRSFGFGHTQKTGQHTKNERILLNSQFGEQRIINENSQQNPIREGFLKRLIGRR